MVLLLTDLALILVMARITGRIARALGQPAVIGEIVGGLLLGPTLFHGAIADALFPLEVRPYLSALANLGLVLFMFLVGLEFDFARIRGCGRAAAGTAIGSALVPFVLGVALALYLLRGRDPASRTGFVLFVAVAVSVTAFPVLARILTERKLGDSRTGALALSAAAICDLAAWTTLAAVQALAGGGRPGHWQVVLVVPYAVVLITCVRPLLRRVLARKGPEHLLSAGNLAIVLTGVLASAAITQALGLHSVIGAFLFGLVTPRMAGTGLRDGLLRRAEFTTALLLPVYFIVAGLNVDLSRIGSGGLRELALVLVVAVTGKFAGTWLGARSQGLASGEAAVLATLMNTRGLTELIALGVGLEAGLLDRGLYSVMVVMAVVTTVMTGPLLQVLTRRGEYCAAPGEAAGPGPVRLPSGRRRHESAG